MNTPLTKAIKDALFFSELVGVDGWPSEAENFLDRLNESGYDIVPIVIIGVAGWTPREFDAYRMGYLAARATMRNDNPTLVEPDI